MPTVALQLGQKPDFIVRGDADPSCQWNWGGDGSECGWVRLPHTISLDPARPHPSAHTSEQPHCTHLFLHYGKGYLLPSVQEMT